MVASAENVPDERNEKAAKRRGQFLLALGKAQAVRKNHTPRAGMHANKSAQVLTSSFLATDDSDEDEEIQFEKDGLDVGGGDVDALSNVTKHGDHMVPHKKAARTISYPENHPNFAAPRISASSAKKRVDEVEKALRAALLRQIGLPSEENLEAMNATVESVGGILGRERAGVYPRRTGFRPVSDQCQVPDDLRSPCHSVSLHARRTSPCTVHVIMSCQICE